MRNRGKFSWKSAFLSHIRPTFAAYCFLSMESTLMMSYGRFIFSILRSYELSWTVRRCVRRCGKWEQFWSTFFHADTFYELDSWLSGAGDERITWIIHQHEHLWFNSIFSPAKFILQFFPFFSPPVTTMKTDFREKHPPLGEMGALSNNLQHSLIDRCQKVFLWSPHKF